MTARTPDGWDIVESLLRTRGSVDHVLVSVADSFGIGIATVTAEGRVAWSDTAYQLHGRPRIDEVHSVDDAAMGATTIDGARVRAAYWLSSESPAINVDYTVATPRGDRELALRNVAAGVIGFYEQSDRPAAPQPDAPIEQPKPAPRPSTAPPSASTQLGRGSAPPQGRGAQPTSPRPDSTPATVSVEQREPVTQTERVYQVPVPTPRGDEQGRRRTDDTSAAGPSRAERVLASSPDIIMVVDVETRRITMMVGDVQAQPRIIENVSAGSSLNDVVIHPDDGAELDRWWSELDTIADDDVRHLEIRLSVEQQWAWRDVRVSQFSRDRDGLLSEVLVVVRDVHEQMEYLRLLESSEKAWRVVFYGSPVGLAVVDREGNFSAVNDSFCGAVGRSREAVLAQDATTVLQADVLSVEGGFLYGKERQLQRPNGSEAWIRIRTRDIEYKEAPHTLITLEDITVAKAAENQLRYAALHNPLSGLPNRELFSMELQQSLHRARRNQSQLAVLFVDLDGLRMINNSEGHQAGDELVRVAAERLRTAFRTSDLVAHRGGDEFLVLCDEVDGPDSVEQLAHRAIDVLRKPVLIGAESIPISASVGAALSIHGNHTSDELERMADLAMYQAKDMGGGTIIIHDSDRSAPLLDLASALERGELRVHYRPVYSLATKVILGFDSVVHWRRGDEVVPAEEISAALYDPSAKPVLLWMLTQAIEDNRVCLPDHVEQLFLWLPTSRSALNQGTAQAAKKATESTDEVPLPSPTVVLIMDEGEVDRIGKPTQVQGRISALLKHGPIAFGINKYTPELLPMSLLRRLPASSVTLDPQIIKDTMTDPGYAEFVSGIVNALNAADIITIAAGIDSPAELVQAHNLGILAAYGDLLGKPYPLMAYADAVSIQHPALVQAANGGDIDLRDGNGDGDGAPQSSGDGGDGYSDRAPQGGGDGYGDRAPQGGGDVYGDAGQDGGDGSGGKLHVPKSIGEALADEFGFNLDDGPSATPR